MKYRRLSVVAVAALLAAAAVATSAPAGQAGANTYFFHGTPS